MRRIVRDRALCLRTRPVRESSKLVTFFARSDGRLTGIAKGARRPKNRFGAALEPFALAEITWYRHQQRTIFTITEATLVSGYPGIAAEPARFLAAEQVGEFLLRTISEHDPNEQLWRLALAYLAEIETAHDRLPVLVLSFLLKGASFLGFRPEVRNCLGCGRPVRENGTRGPGSGGPSGPVLETTKTTESGRIPGAQHGGYRAEILDSKPKAGNRKPSCPPPPDLSLWRFDPRRGGAVCPDCGVAPDAPALTVDRFASLAKLLYSPVAELRTLERDGPELLADVPELLGLVRAFLAHHLESLHLNSLNWREL